MPSEPEVVLPANYIQTDLKRATERLVSIGFESIQRAIKLETSLDQCHRILGWAFEQIHTSSNGAITTEQIIKTIEEIARVTPVEAKEIFDESGSWFGYVHNRERFIISPTSMTNDSQES